MSEGRDVARAIDALRRGWPITIDGCTFLAVETADDARLRELDADGPADLLISGSRATTLKLANQRDGTPTGPMEATPGQAPVSPGWSSLPQDPVPIHGPKEVTLRTTK